MRIMLALLLLLAGLPPAQAGSRLPDHAGRFQPSDRLGIQLQVDEKHPLRIPADATVMEVDLFDTSAATIRKIKKHGRRVLCYFSAGSWEAWRPDASNFPRVLLGKSYAGWPQEHWLDIRHPALRPLLAARLDLARQKGCDGVDPDNVNGFENPTGFPITRADQLRFNRWLAREAHRRGLLIVLKNTGTLAGRLVQDFDAIVSESCLAYDECHHFDPFARAGKPVWVLAYPAELNRRHWQRQCRRLPGPPWHFYALPEQLDGSYRQICRVD